MTTYQIKIVPNLLPDSDGQWLEIEHDAPLPRRWRATEEALRAHIPDGHHLVEIKPAIWPRKI